MKDDPINENTKIAMLIDGENAQPSLISKMITEIGKYGNITIRRIYGDWTQQQMSGWKKHLHEYAVQPVQQFRFTVGKNATDSSLIIDAMDILNDGSVQGFCIVSSDSDYTRLATRIRQSGLFAIGIGEKKTPNAFVKACDRFIYTDILSIPHPHETKKVKEPGKEAKSGGQQELELDELLLEAFDIVVRDDGSAHLGVLGAALRKVDPSFDPRTYGFKQLLQLIKAQSDIFEITIDKDRPNLVIIKLLEVNSPIEEIIEKLKLAEWLIPLLKEHGYHKKQDIAGATMENLVGIPKINPTTARKLITFCS